MVSTRSQLVGTVTAGSPPNAGVVAALPTVETTFALLATVSIPLALFAVNPSIQQPGMQYRVFWVGAFLVNLLTLSIPGRFDSDVANDGAKDPINNFPWKTLFAPASWAFAIWGVIYVSEAMLTAYIGAFGRPMEVLQKAAPFWIAGNLFQSLWCAVFRKKFIKVLWLPTLQLLLGAISLSLSHRELTLAMNNLLVNGQYMELLQLLLIRFPISVHMSWLFAAAALNVNSWAGYSQLAISKQISLTYASVYIAAAVGAAISITWRDPIVAFTFAWALSAIAYQTRKDCQVKVPEIVRESLADTEGAVAKALCGVAVTTATIVLPNIRKALL